MSPLHTIVTVASLGLALLTPAWALAQAPAAAVEPAVAASAAVADPALVRSPLRIEGGVAVATPAALGTGLAVGAGASVVVGEALLVGAALAVSSATEYGTTWHVAHDDFRLRGIVEGRRPLGRADLGLRLGLGVTVVHERRTHKLAGRLGSDAPELFPSSWALRPGAELEGGVALRLAGDWGVIVRAGPAVHFAGGGATVGWSALVGPVWLP